MKITLKVCNELMELRLAWYDKPPRATVDEVWNHRQACPICRENMRLCNLQAQAMVYPEEVPQAMEAI